MNRSAPISRLSLFLFAVTVLISCQTSWYPARTTYSNYEIEDTATDHTADALIAPYRDSMASEMNFVIAHAADDLPKAKPESPLGNLVVDIIFERATDYLGRAPDIAVQNYGGLRIPKLAAGPITRGRVYELMPFENYITITRLEGGTVLQLIERMAADGGWPVAGLQYEIRNHMPENIMIAGKPFQSRKTYVVALPDYLANGGDRCWFLKRWPKEDTGLLIRDVILRYMEERAEVNMKIMATTEGRVTYAE